MADAKIDLDKPAFGEGSQKIEPSTNAPAEVSEETKAKEETPVEPEESGETMVKYSRFKKFHDKALEAEKEAEYWRSVAEKKEPAEVEVVSEVPSFWKELYGDSEASQKAWKIQSEQNEALIQRAKEEAVEAVKDLEVEETERVEKNIESIDADFKAFSSFIGRNLTEKEQEAVLDIVDEYTPKGEDGKYAGETLSLDKAWEIYELKQGASKAPDKASRDSVASLSGSRSQGEPTTKGEEDKNFNPLDWNAWRRKI